MILYSYLKMPTRFRTGFTFSWSRAFWFSMGAIAMRRFAGRVQWLRMHLDKQVTDQQLLYQLTRGMKGNTRRAWKFARSPDEPLPAIAWRMTIVDVAQNVQDAESYSEQVWQWARLTLEQMEDLPGYERP